MLRQLQSYDRSRLWQRLQALADDAHYSGDKEEALAHLISSVRKVASRAASISTQICRTMPQYTLHEKRVHRKDYQRELHLIGISHGRGAQWLRRQTHPDIRPLFKSEIANRQSQIPLLRLKLKKKGEAALSLGIGAWSLGFPGASRRWVLGGRCRPFRNSNFGFRVSRRSRAVGMTEEVIKHYFTQIGKRYCGSPEFNQERAAMKPQAKSCRCRLDDLTELRANMIVSRSEKGVSQCSLSGSRI